MLRHNYMHVYDVAAILIAGGLQAPSNGALSRALQPPLLFQRIGSRRQLRFATACHLFWLGADPIQTRAPTE
eukprot:COSAG01_NODE_4300_length_5161_cov_279.066772_2_plen_72_part_00